jgi:plastocyanin
MHRRGIVLLAGLVLPAAVGFATTPTNLPTGTYAFFCRVHPFMRGSFRVVP